MGDLFPGDHCDKGPDSLSWRLPFLGEGKEIEKETHQPVFHFILTYFT